MFVLYTVLTIGIVIFIFRLALRFASYLAKRMVERRFRTAEVLLKEKKLPDGWARKAVGTERTPATMAPPQEERARRILLKLLDDLTRYFETSPLFDTKETRDLMVRKLDVVYEDWQKRSVREILRQPHPSEQ